ncbi:hypothetical protein BV25DRAFT_1891260 [Artomyces pyxidatus]|uniref:Uncharacterized protein n=1 Tax=Artomyces pyxidatus TaxID=48021 RepID=A0ACB8SRE8_9AGAM|nr:hypothetical protein BV25DRAFT_1891260 [Artomyces pyxidatus]
MSIVDYLHAWYALILHWVFQIQHRQVGHLTKDRQTGVYVREIRPLNEQLYRLVIWNRWMEWLDLSRWWRLHLHHITTTAGRDMLHPETKMQIPGFVKFFKVKMEDFEPSDLDKFHNFDEFFVRRLRPGARPIAEAEDDTLAVIPSDCRAVFFETVAETKKLWIKAREFTIAQLIEDEKAALTWAEGRVGSFRLSLQDYHHYHSPVSGKVAWWKSIPGETYGVDPLAINSDVDVLGRNERTAVCIDSAEFGKVLFVAIGAQDVGSCNLTPTVEEHGVLKKGDEIGWFQFGGSSIVVAFEKERITFDEDLLDVSYRGIEMDVQMGQSMGRATQKM